MAAITNPNDIQKAGETSFQDHLLTYVVYLTKEKFKPNKDENTNFYYGIVTNVVTDDTKQYDRRDIFYSKVDGLERINNSTTKYQSKRSIYFVHIPALHSILFSTETYSKKSELTPEDLYKFRVEQLGKDVESIEVGNVVKVSFENVSNFTGGVIEQKVDDKIFELKLPPHPKNPPKQIFDKVCKQSPLAPSQGQSRTLFNEILSTKEVISLGLYDFLEYFISPGGMITQTEYIYGTATYKIDTTLKVGTEIDKFHKNNINFSQVDISENSEKKVYLVSGKNESINKDNVIRITLENPANSDNNQAMLNYFIVLFSMYGIGTEIIDGKKNNYTIIELTFDIEKINEKDFLIYSQQRYEALKEFNISPVSLKFTTNQVSNIKAAQPNPDNTKCDNILTTDIYIDINSDKWLRKNQDSAFIDLFFNGNKDAALPKGKAYFTALNILSSLEAITNVTLMPEQKGAIVKKSNKFYTFQGPERNTLEGLSGEIGLEKVESNLQLVQKDLKTLKKNIAKNEGLTDQNILMLPISWFEVKPTSTKGQDPDNQHWYGRAVDFVVYIRQNGRIFQIPPEVVALYIEKHLKNPHGIGLFCSQGSYTHYEKLDQLKITQDKIYEERYWAPSDSQHVLEKAINEVSPQDFIFIIKEYIQKNYSFNQIGLPTKLGNLL